MVQQYAPKIFLRQTSNALLQACFSKHGVLTDLPWTEMPEHRIDVIYEAWQKLPSEQRAAIEKLFEDVEELANEQGLQALIDEGAFHRVDIAAEWEEKGWEAFRDRVLSIALKYPRVFEVAGIINHAHTLSNRYWKRRGNMPHSEPNVSVEAIERFRQAISAYFRESQGRGHRCTVDAYLRVKRYHYFFVYPDDYADTYMGHDQDGQFVRRAQRPAFEIVFLFDPVAGTLDLYAHGSKEVQQSLQMIFCRELLAAELPPEVPHGQPYELNGLKSREFGFPTDPADGIEEIQIRKLRLSVLGQTNRRIILEADPAGPPNDVYHMMDKYLNRQNVPDSLINVTLAQLHFRWHRTGEGRQKTLTFDVSYPNSSNLKSKREDLRLVAEKYLKAWGIDRA